MSPQFEILMIAIVVALAASILGVFLVLKKMAMMSDAITHTILLGIVISFFITEDLSSPWLIVGAALMGVVTVYLIEALQSTKLLSEEASIGVIFPFIFSIAILLISHYAGSVHLDTDAVLLGELSFAPFDRMMFLGMSLPKSLIIMSSILLVNCIFVVVFFKELKISSFDPLLSAILGFSPVIIHYMLMTLISVTAVGAFNAVGSILVISFMIGPPITAYLLTHDLRKLMFISSLIAIVNATVGFLFAFGMDVSISGSMAVTTGISFMIAFLFSPTQGLISGILLRKKQSREFAQLTVLFHLYNHESSHDEPIEAGVFSIHEHLKWSQSKIDHILGELENGNYIEIDQEVIKLTPTGRQLSIDYYNSIFEN